MIGGAVCGSADALDGPILLQYFCYVPKNGQDKKKEDFIC